MEKISFSQYDIYQKLLEVAGRHIPTSSISDFLRVGMFGYITESLAMGLRDSALLKTFLYNEGFLNTAIIPESIYNYAKMFNVSLPTAIPSKGYINIQIPETDFQQYKTTYNANGQYGLSLQYTNAIVISNKGGFNVGSYPFKLERSIIIYQNENGNILAEYINPTNPDLILTNFASTALSGVDYYKNNQNITVTRRNGNIILNHVMAYQFEIFEKAIKIASNRTVDNMMFRIEYENQFAGIVVKYNRNSRRNSTTQNIIPVFSPIDPKIAEYQNSNKLFCFYDLESDNHVKIRFKTDGFIPLINSSLTLSAITTSGIDISTNISGNFRYSLADTATNAVSITVSFEGALSGGTNMPSIDNMRARIINEISTRNIILTEDDINNYFALLTASWLGYDSKIIFKKKRDDILKRIFSAYCVLRSGMDAAGNINTSSNFLSMAVPTNTIDVHLAPSIDNNGNSNILTQTVTTGSKFTLNNDNTYTNANSGLNDYYFVPFDILLMLAPVRRVVYRYLMTDSESYLYLKPTGNTLPKSYNVIGEKLHLYRGMKSNATIDDNYRFTLTLTSNADISNLKIGSDGKIKLKIDSANVEDDIEIDSGNIELSNYRKLESGNQYSIDINFNVPNNSNIPESANVELTLDQFIISNTDVNESYFTLIFKTETPLIFYRSLEGVIDSDLQLLTTTDNRTTTLSGIKLLSVPVIHSSFLNFASNVSTAGLTTYQIEKLVKQLSMNILMLQDGLSKLEANSQFDLKFFNTHGPSMYYNVSNTNFLINIDIALTKNITEAEKDLIRDYIRRVVDQGNDNGFLNTSDIITMTINNFNSNSKIIQNIYINSVDNQAIAIVSPTNTLSALEVPEYITFPLDPDAIRDAITFRVV